MTSRRQFLKGAGLIAASAATARLPAPDEPTEGGCPRCGQARDFVDVTSFSAATSSRYWACGHCGASGVDQ